MGSIKDRKWCFDIFYMHKKPHPDKEGEFVDDLNKGPKIKIDWKELYEEYKDIIRYLVVQHEIGETNGRKHWQGYIQFFDQVRRRQLQGITTAWKIKHWCEPARGCVGSNQDYCTKLQTSTGEKYEYGEPCTQGVRTDLQRCRKILKNGGSMLDIAENEFGSFIRYHKGFQKYKDLLDMKQRQHRRDVHFEIISGTTGTGKTSGVLNKYFDNNLGDNKVFIMDFNKGTEWWDGYNGEEIVLIDDYNNDININRLLRLTDQYKVRLPYKGGFTYANWTKFYITTNLTKDEIHKQAKPEHRRALFDRCSKFTRLEGKSKRKVGKMSQSESGNTGLTALRKKDIEIPEIDDNSSEIDYTPALNRLGQLHGIINIQTNRDDYDKG